ncbi:MAG: hypothetical protein COB78_10620 [Hyphomicrobiales bacterium]|nr:MAG: hypothetical protein COB78_10620 [Hyphomicrobiales bacterium]
MASGFIVAGLVSAMHQTISGTNAQFRLSFSGPLVAIWSLFVCLFAGPYIVIKSAGVYWINGALSGAIMASCALLSMFWSFCSGIFVVQTLYIAGVI